MRKSEIKKLFYGTIILVVLGVIGIGVWTIADLPFERLQKIAKKYPQCQVSPKISVLRVAGDFLPALCCGKRLINSIAF